MESILGLFLHKDSYPATTYCTENISALMDSVLLCPSAGKNIAGSKVELEGLVGAHHENAIRGG